MEDAEQPSIGIGKPAAAKRLAHVVEAELQDLGDFLGLKKLIEQDQILVGVPGATWRRRLEIGDDGVPAGTRCLDERVDMAGRTQRLAIMGRAEQAQQFAQANAVERRCVPGFSAR